MLYRADDQEYVKPAKALMWMGCSIWWGQNYCKYFVDNQTDLFFQHMFMLPLSPHYVCTYFFTPCEYNITFTEFRRSSFKSYGANITATKVSTNNDGLLKAYASHTATPGTLK